MNNIIIGKRIPVGSVILSVATIFSFIFPEYAPAIIAAAVPITFMAQVVVVNCLGVTQ